MSFTLAICTYNRANLLRHALESLVQCHAPTTGWKLLVVDNNSTDATAEVVDSFRGQLPVARCFEPAQGLSAARNCALSACTTDVLLFTDDDLRFDRDWLLRYEEAFLDQPQAGWFGGRVRPLWDQGRPSWLKDENLALISGLLVHYDLGAGSRSFEPSDPSPFGASFALRRSVFEQYGGFRLDLGVKGNVPARGEEAEYFDRLRAAKVPGWYVGESSAWHWQDLNRLRVGYLYRYGIQKGVAELRMAQNSEYPRGAIIDELKYAVRALVQLAKGRGDRARQCIINMGIERGRRSGSRV